MWIANCDETSFKLGNFCISEDDLVVILVNLVVVFCITILLYNIKLLDKSENLSVVVKNNFALLGEGVLAQYYSPMNTQQKNTNTKKKNVIGKNAPAASISTNERSSGLNELKCNTCGRTVQVSYQYTLHKLSSS